MTAYPIKLCYNRGLKIVADGINPLTKMEKYIKDLGSGEEMYLIKETRCATMLPKARGFLLEKLLWYKKI